MVCDGGDDADVAETEIEAAAVVEQTSDGDDDDVHLKLTADVQGTLVCVVVVAAAARANPNLSYVVAVRPRNAEHILKEVASKEQSQALEEGAKQRQSQRKVRVLSRHVWLVVRFAGAAGDQQAQSLDAAAAAALDSKRTRHCLEYEQQRTREDNDHLPNKGCHEKMDGSNSLGTDLD